jgi:hypothetical protein
MNLSLFKTIFKRKHHKKNACKKVEEFTDKFKAMALEHHNRITEKEIELQNTFDINENHSLTLNLWDDFEINSEGRGDTKIIVEGNDSIPEVVIFKILYSVLTSLESQDILSKNVRLNILFENDIERYPMMVHEFSFILRRAWVIQASNISSNDIENILCAFPKALKLFGVDVSIISES